MYKVGLLCDQFWFGKSVDNKLLQQIAKTMNIECEEVIWQRADEIIYSEYDAVLIRNTWGYHHDTQKYISVLNTISQNTILLNDIEIVLNNIYKEQQLRRLKEVGIKTIPFEIFDENNTCELEKRIVQSGYKKIVLKPNISASGNDCILLDVSQSKFVEYRRILNNYIDDVVYYKNKKIIMQPFMSEIEDGEISLIYFFGKFSHSVIRYPGVLFEKKKTVELKNISSDCKNFADEISKLLNLQKVLYTRIDMVNSREGPVIMEIEQNEPDLFFRIMNNNEEVITNYWEGVKSCFN